MYNLYKHQKGRVKGVLNMIKNKNTNLITKGDNNKIWELIAKST